jgi:hypothetical protein
MNEQASTGSVLRRNRERQRCHMRNAAGESRRTNSSTWLPTEYIVLGELYVAKPNSSVSISILCCSRYSEIFECMSDILISFSGSTKLLNLSRLNKKRVPEIGTICLNTTWRVPLRGTVFALKFAENYSYSTHVSYKTVFREIVYIYISAGTWTVEIYVLRPHFRHYFVDLHVDLHSCRYGALMCNIMSYFIIIYAILFSNYVYSGWSYGYCYVVFTTYTDELGCKDDVNRYYFLDNFDVRI